MYGIKRSISFFLLPIILIFTCRGARAEDWFQKGLTLLRTHEYPAAVRAFSTALEKDPARLAAYNNRGLAWCHLEAYNRALKDYNTAVGIDPRCAELYNNRGALWFYLGQYRPGH